MHLLEIITLLIIITGSILLAAPLVMDVVLICFTIDNEWQSRVAGKVNTNTLKTHARSQFWPTASIPNNVTRWRDSSLSVSKTLLTPWRFVLILFAGVCVLFYICIQKYTEYVGTALNAYGPFAGVDREGFGPGVNTTRRGGS